jgi:lipopolysaccharide export system permease protein
MTFFICVFVLLMQFLWKYIDDMVGKGLEWNIIAELLVYASFGLVPLAFPLAMLLSSIMTFGSLGENYELVAMKASGISLFRIMRPLMIVAIGITILAFYFSNNILPKANLKATTLLWSVKQQKPEMVIQEGVFANDMENYSIKVGEKGKNGMLYDLMIYDHSDNAGNINVTVADSGMMKLTPDKKYMTLTLYSGNTYNETKEDGPRSKNRRFPFRREHFQREEINISMKDFEFNRSDESMFQNSYRMMDMVLLKKQEDSLYVDYRSRIWRFIASTNYSPDINRQAIALANPTDSLRKMPVIRPDTLIDVDAAYASLDSWGKQDLLRQAISDATANSHLINQQMADLYGRKKLINKYGMEWHRKFTLSFACLIFFFIGAPLGAIIRRGGLGMPVVVSILMFIAYYMVSISGEKFAREDVWTMFKGMWFSSLLFLPLGIFLTYKAATDSGIMNLESYQLFFKRLTGFVKRNKKHADAHSSGNE